MLRTHEYVVAASDSDEVSARRASTLTFTPGSPGEYHIFAIGFLQ